MSDSIRRTRSPIKVSSDSRGYSLQRSMTDSWMRSSGEGTPRAQEPFWIHGVLGFLVVCEAISIGAQVSYSSRDQDYDTWYILKSLVIFMWISIISARLYYKGRSSFRGWLLFDIALTVVAMIDAWVLRFVIRDRDLKIGSFEVERQLRIAMVLRLFRLFSILRLSGRLRRLSDGLLDSIRVTSMVLAMLVVVLYCSGVYMTIVVGHTCHTDYGSWIECEDLFGSVYGSMVTLFQLMTLDDWGMLIVRPILKEKAWLWVFILPFLMVTTFGLLNVIVGAVVEHSLKAADEQRRVEEQIEEQNMRQDLEHVKTFFVQADRDKNGFIDMDEFLLVLQNKEFKTILKKLALPTDNPHWLFDVFDVEEKGAVSIHDFIQGLFKFREQPKPLDMHTALMQIHGLTSKMQHMETLILMLLAQHGIKDPTQRRSAKTSGYSAARQSTFSCFAEGKVGHPLEEKEMVEKASISKSLSPFASSSSELTEDSETKLAAHSHAVLRQSSNSTLRQPGMKTEIGGSSLKAHWEGIDPGRESKVSFRPVSSLPPKVAEFPQQVKDLHLERLQAQIEDFEASISRCFAETRRVQASLQARANFPWKRPVTL